MIFRRKFMLPVAAFALAAASLPSYAAEQWAPTATKATTVVNTASSTVAHVAALQAGTPTHIVVALKLRNKDALDALTNRLMTGTAARPITSADFMSRFAPTQAQAQAVVDHLKKSGFVNVTVSENRMLVSADGTAGAVKAGFNTDLQSYTVNGRAAHANVTDAQVPASLAGIVLAVHGLQTVHMHHIMAKPMTTTLSSTGHNPTEFSAIYNATSLPSATNAVIGIITQGDMAPTIADLRTFTSRAGYPTVNVQTVTVGAASTDQAGIGEWNMDTQDSLAAAGGTISKMLLYTATTLSDADLTNTYNKAVTDNLAKTINVSLGECETAAQSSGITASNDQIFQTAVAQGQTFSVSSGDSGAYECGGPGTAQSYPAVSPYVIALGGSLLDTSGTTWLGESVWSCTGAASCQQSASGGAGGGPSLTEAAPSWQINAGVLHGATKRGTPDISLDASPASGALVIVNGATQQIGGTSLAAPLFTGFWARVQSMNGNSLAFPASKMYASAAANPSMFHDITSGNQGYAAATGWDYASGYGSLNMANFAAVMGNSAPPPPPPPPGGDVLANGVQVNGITLATGASHMYTFNVPTGATNLTFKTGNGTGDSDLYVRFGSAPTTSTYDFISDGSTTTESISVPTARVGTYYVMVYGYSAPSNVSLIASYSTAPTGGGNVLSNGVPVSNLALSSGQSRVFTFTVPAGRPSVTFKTSGGTGDCDIYVKLGSAPTTSSYLAKSDGYTTAENITISTPTAGTYYLLLNSYATFSGVTLVASD